MRPSPTVSVVTPFHNTAEYLEEAICSVLRQDFTDFEYILVDNQSTDGSSDIAHRYAERDSRIRLFKTDRLLGQVENYNFALTHISPDSYYTKICQADDWLYPQCLTEMVRCAEQSERIGIVSAYLSRDTWVSGAGLPISATRLPGRTPCRLHLLHGVFLFGTPTSIMFRSDLVRQRQPFFDTGRLHEDTEVCFEILKDNDFGFVHQVLAYARTESASTMGRRADMLPAAIDRLVVVKRFGHAFLDAAEYAHCWHQAQTEYYRSLGMRMLRRPLRRSPKSFWEYQYHGLDLAGERLKWTRLVWATFVAACRVTTSPIETWRMHRSRNGGTAYLTEIAS